MKKVFGPQVGFEIRVFVIFLKFHHFFFFWDLSYFSMLILSLPLSGLSSKSTSLSPGFSVCGPRQYNTICWELNLIFEFFAFFWLSAWVGGINKCGWCFARSRGWWIKGPHQIPNVSWIYNHSLHFHIYQIASFVPGILCPLYFY